MPAKEIEQEASGRTLCHRVKGGKCFKRVERWLLGTEERGKWGVANQRVKSFSDTR